MGTREKTEPISLNRKLQLCAQIRLAISACQE
jgi:hypothetical protein